MVLFRKHIFALFKRKGIMLMKRKTDKYTHCKRYEGKTTGRKIMDYHLKYSLAHSLRRDSALNRITTVQHKTIQHNMPLYILQSGTYLLQRVCKQEALECTQPDVLSSFYAFIPHRNKTFLDKAESK